MQPCRIDSHHHAWQYDAHEYPWISDSMGILRHDYLGPELKNTLKPHDVVGTVAVQARQSILETDWLLRLASSTDEILGVVGWAPLRESLDQLRPLLEAWSSQPKLKGFRHVVQDEPDVGFLLGSEFNRGVSQLTRHGWTYDLLVFPHQLPSAVAFVDRHPDQRFVLDHMGKPAISSGAFDHAWEVHFRELSKRPHVACKFSGLVTEVREDAWDVNLLRPYWDCAIDSFGIDRLMFGSDWPVCLIRSTYNQWIQCVEELTEPLTETENELFWTKNAVEFYGLTDSEISG